MSSTQKQPQRRRGRPARERYQPLVIPFEETASFASVDTSWDGWEARLIDGITGLDFGPDFAITDAHLDAIVEKCPSFCQQLLFFNAGDAETGEGWMLTDDGVARFAKACPSLQHVSIKGATKLGDAALLSLLNDCPDIRYIQISGNDRIEGSLTGAPLDVLRERQDVASKLAKLRVTDQKYRSSSFKKAARQVTKQRKHLEIMVGSTDPRDRDICFWVQGQMLYDFEMADRGTWSKYGGYAGWV